MAKVHDRILEITGLVDESDNTIAVSAVKYYRDRGMLDAGVGYSLTFTPTSAIALAGGEIVFGELVPPPTHLRFNVTTQA